MAEATIEHRDLVARCLLTALARREQSGQAPRRLTEPGLATWHQLRGNLDLPHLVGLLAEDASVRFPLPADARRVFAGQRLDFGGAAAGSVGSWLAELTPARLDAPRAEALAEFAKALGLPQRFAGAELHKIQADKRVLELPGTGGLLVARALERSPEATLHTNTTVLTSGWADRAMAGLVAMSFDTPQVDFIHDDPELAWATSPEQRNRFDLVFGLLPEKGGAFDADTLRARFPAATVVLV